MTTMKQSSVSAWADEPLVEEDISCSLNLRVTTEGALHPCPNKATVDAIVTCPKDHLRTQHYCGRCQDVATSGNLPCRECRAENISKEDSIITILAIYKRNSDD